jgi:hypothetical protein
LPTQVTQVGNAGGVGTAFHTAYVSGESTQLKYAVIKKPHENRKEVFRSETAGAELAGNFGSQYINKILHAGKDFAIFETGQNVRSLYQEIQTTSPRQSLILIRQVMEGHAGLSGKWAFPWRFERSKCYCH